MRTIKAWWGGRLKMQINVEPVQVSRSRSLLWMRTCLRRKHAPERQGGISASAGEARRSTACMPKMCREAADEGQRARIACFASPSALLSEEGRCIGCERTCTSGVGPT